MMSVKAAWIASIRCASSAFCGCLSSGSPNKGARECSEESSPTGAIRTSIFDGVARRPAGCDIPVGELPGEELPERELPDRGECVNGLSSGVDSERGKNCGDTRTSLCVVIGEDSKSE